MFWGQMFIYIGFNFDFSKHFGSWFWLNFLIFGLEQMIIHLSTLVRKYSKHVLDNVVISPVCTTKYIAFETEQFS